MFFTFSINFCSFNLVYDFFNEKLFVFFLNYTRVMIVYVIIPDQKKSLLLKIFIQEKKIFMKWTGTENHCINTLHCIELFKPRGLPGRSCAPQPVHQAVPSAQWPDRAARGPWWGTAPPGG